MSEYKPIDECKTVEELLADPARWTKYEMARDADGEVVMKPKERWPAKPCGHVFEITEDE